MKDAARWSWFGAVLLASLVVACAERPPALDPPRVGAPSASPPSPPPTAKAAPLVADASTPPSDASSAATAATDAGPPAPVTRTGKVWPFHAWTRAEAIAFNEFPMRPGVQTVAYGPLGWARHLGARKPLNAPQSKTAVDLVVATEGSVDVSKCPFPRHAVVLFDGELPVASINVCFECGDIRVWPSFTPDRDWDKLSAKERAALEKRYARQQKLYESAFPKWQAFFRDEAGFAVDKKYGPERDPAP